MRRLFLVALALVACTSALPAMDAGSDASARDAPRTYVPDPFEPTPDTIAYCQGRDDAAIEARISALLRDLSRRARRSCARPTWRSSSPAST